MSETDNKITDIHCSALQKTLDFYQNIITRMGENSRNCKTWCLTLVSAIALWTFRVDQPWLMLFSLIPVLMLWFLDAYYLDQERKFRKIYNSIVNMLHEGNLLEKHMYVINPNGFYAGKVNQWKSLPHSLKCMFNSPATLPFYGMLAVLLLIILTAAWFCPEVFGKIKTG